MPSASARAVGLLTHVGHHTTVQTLSVSERPPMTGNKMQFICQCKSGDYRCYKQVRRILKALVRVIMAADKAQEQKQGQVNPTARCNGDPPTNQTSGAAAAVAPESLERSSQSQFRPLAATETWGTGMGHGASIIGVAARCGNKAPATSEAPGHKSRPEPAATDFAIHSPPVAMATSSTTYPPPSGVPLTSSRFANNHDEDEVTASTHAAAQRSSASLPGERDVEGEGKAADPRTRFNMGKYDHITGMSKLRRRLHRNQDNDAHDDLDDSASSSSADCFSAIRFKWDAVKTATPARRFALACAAEFLGAWIYSFVLWGTVYNMLAATYASIETAMMSLYYFLGATAGVYFTLLVASPVAGGHFVPHITIVSTLVGIFPLWKAPFYIVAQCLGYWIGQLMAVRTAWDWINDLRKFLLEESGGDTSVFFSHSASSRTPLSGFFIYFKPGLRSWSSVVFTEVVLNFLLGLVICGSFDISNPYVSPSNSIWPIALAAGTFFGFFSPPSQSLDPARWMSGFTCWIIFDDRKRCFPAKETLFVILTPILGLLLAYVWYAAFISDSRRPAASQMLSDVDDLVKHRAEEAKARQAKWISKQTAKKAAENDLKLLHRPLLPSETADVVQHSAPLGNRYSPPHTAHDFGTPASNAFQSPSRASYAVRRPGNLSLDLSGQERRVPRKSVTLPLDEVVSTNPDDPLTPPPLAHTQTSAAHTDRALNRF